MVCLIFLSVLEGNQNKKNCLVNHFYNKLKSTAHSITYFAWRKVREISISCRKLLKRQLFLFWFASRLRFIFWPFKRNDIWRPDYPLLQTLRFHLIEEWFAIQTFLSFSVFDDARLSWEVSTDSCRIYHLEAITQRGHCSTKSCDHLRISRGWHGSLGLDGLRSLWSRMDVLFGTLVQLRNMVSYLQLTMVKIRKEIYFCLGIGKSNWDHATFSKRGYLGRFIK